jgi:epsilon-lactone hydrolase
MSSMAIATLLVARVAVATEDLRDVVPSTVSPAAAAAMRQATQMRGKFAMAIAPPKTLEEWQTRRRELDAMVTDFTAPLLARLAPSLREGRLADVPVIFVTPRLYREGSRLLIYVHGGAHTMMSAHSSLASAALMAQASGLEIVSVDYVLAPPGDWRTATDQVVAVYRALLAQGHKPRAIGMFGDSAGGGLVAGSVFKMRDMRIPLPGALVLQSPWMDVTGAGDSYLTLAQADPLLSMRDLQPSADAYADPKDQRHPYVSPVYGDFRKAFPPTLIQGGTREIFLSDFVRAYQAIGAGGGVAVLDLYEGMPHVFQVTLPDTPEAQAAMVKASRFWQAHLARTK